MLISLFEKEVDKNYFQRLKMKALNDKISKIKMDRTEVYITELKKSPKKVLCNITFKNKEVSLKQLEEIILRGDTLEIFSRGEIRYVAKSIKKIQTFISIIHLFKIELGYHSGNGGDFLLKAKFDILLDKFIDKSFALFINRLASGKNGKFIKKLKKLLRKEREKLKENFIAQLGVDFPKVIKESKGFLLLALDYFLVQGEMLAKGTLFNPVENIDFKTLISEEDELIDFLIQLNSYILAGLYGRTNDVFLKSVIKKMFDEYLEEVISF